MPFANSVILYNCKLNHNGLFVCDFGGSGAARDSTMGSTNDLATVKFTMSNCTYLRKDKVIVVDQNADVLDAAGVNYCRFINTDFDSSLYIYAFVDEIEYVAPQTSRLHVRTDCFTTYFHRITPNDCFVEREHVSNDTPFYHSLPENVGTGELERYQGVRILGDAINNDDNSYIAAFNIATDDPQQLGLGEFLGSVKVGGIISGTHWYGVEMINTVRFSEYLISKGANILCISQVPKCSMWTADGEDITISGETVHVYHLRDIYPSEAGYSSSLQLNIHSGAVTRSGNAAAYNAVTIVLDSYISTFKLLYNNLKLLCYPYTAFELYTYDGGEITLIPQDVISQSWAPFSDYNYYLYGTDALVGGPNPSETFNLARTLNGLEVAPVARQSFARFPTLAMTADSYSSYMARNANSLKFQKDIAIRDTGRTIINTAFDAAKDLVKVDLQGLINDYYNFISAGDRVDAIEAKMRDMKAAPDGTVGQASDGTLYRLNRLGVYFGIKRVNIDILQSIDSFFDRYGYCVNVTKTPQWNSRPKFNYVKTCGANISGQIPASDKKVINDLLDNGLTVWHSVGDYGTYDGANNLAIDR